MSKNPAPPNRLPNHHHDIPTRFAPRCVLLLAFLLRLWKASGTFLNMDEAMHSMAANTSSLEEAYRASLGLAHPPLLILLLNMWRNLGTSELALRMPSVIAGTIFCWVFFKWLTRLLGPIVGWVGFALVCFLPPLVELSAEVRQYALLLCFLIAAAYFLELALAENSVGKMLFFFVCLFLAMLTHFSAILFAGAVGLYSLWRLIGARLSRHVVAVWIAGQAGALGLLTFLYRTQISNLKASAAMHRHVEVFLSNSYFHRGHGNLLLFAFSRTFGVLQYTFGQLAVGDIAGVLFVIGVTLLLKGNAIQGRRMQDPLRPSSRQVGVFLALPFLINCVAAMFDLYPYGGTRHSAFLVPFAVAGASYAIAWLARQRLAYALGTALLIIAACQVFGRPHRPYMLREDQRRANMTQAMDAIREQVQPGDTLFVDFQTSFLLRFYLCPEIGDGEFSAAGFRAFSCGGKRVIATSSESNVLTADTFVRRFNEMVNAYALQPDQAVWIFQAGWDIGLAQELQEKVPEFHDLKYESFGRNISLFKMTTRDHVGTAVLSCPAEQSSAGLRRVGLVGPGSIPRGRVARGHTT
jgi:dolichyl-phosphate-mannose-protein mannosyltransferase